jgi:4-hydroxy-3-methylbut-2-enyl diphosphate reductase
MSAVAAEPLSAPERELAPAAERGLLLIAPMGIEARALRRALPEVEIARSGVGPRRARRIAAQLASQPAGAVAVAGFAGALSDALEPGELVVASELLTPSGAVAASCPGAGVIAGLLARRGLAARVGPVVSVQAPALGAARRAMLARTGALAVDMESAWLAAAAAGRPFAVVRAVMDTPRHELWRPRAVLAGIRAASRSLWFAATALAEWERAVAPRELVMAAPRASCAGVERAIDVVERTLDQYGAPVYMRKQIVHNRHVVAELERRGAICVDDLDEIPDGSTVVFSAHGVSPQVRRQAEHKELRVVDATCPLVGKVHAEARRFAKAGYTIVLVGHEGHEEIEGTAGEAPAQIHVIARAEEVDALEVEDPQRVAYLTQTTLAVDETAGVVERLRERFPEIVGPRSDDICYATQNRQDAVRALADSCDVVLVVGSRNSSNSNRLVEVARRRGCAAHLVDDETQIDPRWLAGARRVGVTAGASSPERIVQRVVRALRVLGELQISEHAVARENVRFALPREVRV